MIGKSFVGKLIGGMAAAGLLAAVMTTGAFAAPATSAGSSTGPTVALKEGPPQKDVFRGAVTAVSQAQLTVKNPQGVSKTFVRTGRTQVFKGRTVLSWSDIALNNVVGVRYAERNGKLHARRIQIGLAHAAGKVLGVDGNVITLATRTGKAVRVTVNGETKFFEGRKTARNPATLGDIKPGQRLAAAGSFDKSGNFDAAVVLFWDASKTH